MVSFILPVLVLCNPVKKQSKPQNKDCTEIALSLFSGVYVVAVNYYQSIIHYSADTFCSKVCKVCMLTLAVLC